MTRATAARARRAETAVLLAGRLDRIAIGHLDGLTPAEAGLLAETVRAMTADIERLARDRLGLMRARTTDIEKRAAAEQAIREAEADRDAAREELAAVRAYDRALSEALGPAHPATFAVGGKVCGTCRAWVPGRLSLPHTCPPSSALVVELLRDETGQPICTCTYDQQCPACTDTTKET
ncbi:hypothetical protein [Streptomyces sp. NPDC056549]|uniref:hypothetical protein n=1 Tax=Streptomyces sp. NPDC056549 TaxID=3345864 RepID=UPI0036B790E7